MNWKENLNELLSNRKVGTSNRIEIFLKVQNEIILPTFKEIDKLLSEHQLICSIDYSNCSLKLYGFTMSTALEDDNIKVTFSYLNPIEPEELGEYKESKFLSIPLLEVTNEVVGELFYNEFKKLFLLVNKKKQIPHKS